MPPRRGPRLNIYVLMNNKVDPDFQVITQKVLEIAARAASSSLKAQARSELFARYAAAQRSGFGINLTFIDQDVPSTTSIGFDTADMRRLYRYGFEKALLGQLWMRELPSGEFRPHTRPEGSTLRFPQPSPGRQALTD